MPPTVGHSMANKSLLIVGGICIVLALASFGIVWSTGNDGIDELESIDINDYIEGPNTSYTFTFIDVDGAGSSGFYILMDGTYDDVDEDGMTDVCQDVVFKVTDSQGVDVTEDASQLTCLAPDDNSEFFDEMLDELPDDGRVIFGYVCATIDTEIEYKCNIGENYTISSEVSIYVLNHDEYDLAFLGGLEQLIGSGLFAIAGSCCCGLGGILLLVGLLTGGNSAPVIGYMPQQGMAPGMQMQTQTPVQPIGEMPQQQQYEVGTDIDSSSVADTPVSVWDN